MCNTAREHNIEPFVSKTRRVINSMLSGKIKPLYNDEILAEYFDVLSRSKFHLSEVRINELLYFIKQNGIDSSRFPCDGEMPDENDRVFNGLSETIPLYDFSCSSVLKPFFL